MTVEKVAVLDKGTHLFTGLAADTKPTEGIPPGSRFVEADTGKRYSFAGGIWYFQSDKNDAPKISSYSAIKTATTTVSGQSEALATGVEKLIITNVEADDWERALVDIGDNSTTVFTGACTLGKIYVDTVLSAHAVPILDNATTVASLIASLAAGSEIGALEGLRFGTSLIIDPDDAGTGNIVVQYKPDRTVLVAFGTSAANAESNVANGFRLLPGRTKELQRPANATYWAWLGLTTSVSIDSNQAA